MPRFIVFHRFENYFNFPFFFFVFLFFRSRPPVSAGFTLFFLFFLQNTLLLLLLNFIESNAMSRKYLPFLLVNFFGSIYALKENACISQFMRLNVVDGIMVDSKG